SHARHDVVHLIMASKEFKRQPAEFSPLRRDHISSISFPLGKWETLRINKGYSCVAVAASNGLFHPGPPIFRESKVKGDSPLIVAMNQIPKPYPPLSELLFYPGAEHAAELVHHLQDFGLIRMGVTIRDNADIFHVFLGPAGMAIAELRISSTA